MASTDPDVHDRPRYFDFHSVCKHQHHKRTKKGVRHKFSSWTFQLKFSADAAALNGGYLRYIPGIELHDKAIFLLVSMHASLA
jgi:hypothetical protein